MKGGYLDIPQGPGLGFDPEIFPNDILKMSQVCWPTGSPPSRPVYHEIVR